MVSERKDCKTEGPSTTRKVVSILEHPTQLLLDTVRKQYDELLSGGIKSTVPWVKGFLFPSYFLYKSKHYL